MAQLRSLTLAVVLPFLAAVLEAWAASGPGGPFGALQKAGEEGNVVVLDYATSVKDSVARLELRPFADTLRIAVRLLVSKADARLRLEARSVRLLVWRRLSGLPRPAGLAAQ